MNSYFLFQVAADVGIYQSCETHFLSNGYNHATDANALYLHVLIHIHEKNSGYWKKISQTG